MKDLVQKGLDALPEGWTGGIADDLGTEATPGSVHSSRSARARTATT